MGRKGRNLFQEHVLEEARKTMSEVSEMQQSPPTFEITTTAKLSQPLSVSDLASALLDPSEFESCKQPHYRIIIFDKIIFSGKEAVYRAILQIADPKYINDGAIKAEKRNYFNWSQAKIKIAKKYGLSNVSYRGTKNRITALMLSSMAHNDDEHAVKVRQVIRAVTAKFPKVLFQWEECVRTVACSVAKFQQATNSIFSSKEVKE